MGKSANARAVILRFTSKVTIVAALVAISGCTTGSGSNQAATPSGSASTPSPSPSPQVDYSENTKQTCAEWKKLNEDLLIGYAQDLLKFGPLNTIKDSKTKAAVVAAAKKLLGDWASSLRALAGKAKDPTIKKAVTDSAQSLDQEAARITTFEDVATDLAAPDLTAVDAVIGDEKTWCGI